VATIFLTGCAGFIGSHVAVQLLTRGDTVVGIDNLNDYYDPARKRANLEVVSAVPTGKFEFVHGDIRDRPLLAELFGKHKFDAVIHLAAMAGVRASMDDPHLYFDVNLTGTLNLLDATRDHKVGNFVFASTSSAYGDTKVIPFIETDMCDKPMAPYPASKRAAELLGYTYHHLYKVNFTALRFFTVYGTRGRPDMMAYKVLDSIFNGTEVPLYEGGNMFRDWTYVTDIAAGVVAAADRPLGYEQINLGRGEPVNLGDFVKMVEELAGKKANLKASPMIAADISYTFADITKARTLLGYDPKVSAPDGVRMFWEWYRDVILGRARS